VKAYSVNPSHERTIPFFHRKKLEASVEWAKAEGAQTVIELFAGTGILSRLYQDAGIRPVLCVENDPGRFEKLRQVVGAAALLADNRRLPFAGPLDADLLDFDPFGYPYECLLANRNRLRVGQLILVTVSAFQVKLNRRLPKFWRTLARETFGFSHPYERQLAEGRGIGIGPLVTRDFLNALVGKVSVLHDLGAQGRATCDRTMFRIESLDHLRVERRTA